MTITIGAASLLRMLTDLLDTVGAGGIRLDSHRAEVGDEPGLRDVLAGFSSTGYVIGHTWTECIGDGPSTVWPADAAGIVAAICKTIANKSDLATVDIIAETAPPPENSVDGEHPGWTVTVRETPALFGSDTEFEFHAGAAEEEQKLWDIFTQTPELADPRFVESAQTAWSINALSPLLRIAKRRCTSKRTEPVRLFRASDRSIHLAQIGDDWLGAVVPLLVMPDHAGERPTIDPLLPVKVLDT